MMSWAEAATAMGGAPSVHFQAQFFGWMVGAGFMCVVRRRWRLPELQEDDMSGGLDAGSG